MTSNKKDPVLVVLQLSGGNDYPNTVIPYTDPLYWDARPGVKIPESDIIDLDGKLGFHPSMQVIKDIYDQGNAAISEVTFHDFAALANRKGPRTA